jgi:hypothetical protein
MTINIMLPSSPILTVVLAILAVAMLIAVIRGILDLIPL